ncbi:MAG: hypothetical protein ACWA40_03965 [Planktomarina sp.]
MTHLWILDVLSDLKRFADQNDLTVLARQLEDTMIVAEAEFASKHIAPDGAKTDWDNGALAGKISGNLGASERPS